MSPPKCVVSCSTTAVPPRGSCAAARGSAKLQAARSRAFLKAKTPSLPVLATHILGSWENLAVFEHKSSWCKRAFNQTNFPDFKYSIYHFRGSSVGQKMAIELNPTRQKTSFDLPVFCACSVAQIGQRPEERKWLPAAAVWHENNRTQIWSISNSKVEPYSRLGPA